MKRIILFLAVMVALICMASCGSATGHRERGWGCPDNPYFQR